MAVRAPLQTHVLSGLAGHDAHGGRYLYVGGCGWTMRPINLTVHGRKAQGGVHAAAVRYWQ